MNEKQINKEIIICGGGMAGLSLAYYLNKSSKLRKKSILIIEPTKKDKNDRTWAFWQHGVSAFDAIVFKQWQQVAFINQMGKQQTLGLDKYRYKLLKGIDFYDFVRNDLKQNFNIEFIQDSVISIEDDGKATVEVKTASGKEFVATKVFDSTFKLNLSDTKNHNLLQHFKGWVIETSAPCFDINLPVMMDFSIEQKNSECRFVYILPHSPNKALIEFTLFSEKTLEQQEYDEVLKKYISEHFKSAYKIIEEEYGIIPMSDVPIQEFPSKNVVRIGTSGGYTNPATGYTFLYTQKRLQSLVKSLEDEKPFKNISWWQKRHRFYASVLLNVLQKKRHLAADIFYKLYLRNSPSSIFVFLDGETNFWQELRIMVSMHIPKFWYATLDVIWRKIYL